ncbi:J domain-containing protein [Actinomadura kijaniata]|uniref:J domain-containing protein n=1 Tax=Actinomadura kijaniata TaxID=46161 RepID=UPI003F1A39D5
MGRTFAELGGRDAYEVLGVPPDASAARIKRAYRALARTEHSDVSARPDAQERMSLITAAYEAVTRYRASYDAFRTASAEPDPEPEPEPETVDDPWDDAAPGTPAPDPWETATAGRPTPPPPPFRTTTAPPPFVYAPPPPPPPRYVRPRRRMSLGPKIGIGCAVLWASWSAVFVVSAFVAAWQSRGPQPEVAVPAELAGTWKGRAKDEDRRQNGRDRGWAVEVVLRDGERNGEVRYLDGRCTGTAVPVALDKRTLRLRTVFPEDRKGCDVGDIHLTRRKGDKADFVIYRDHSRAKESTAVLTRR